MTAHLFSASLKRTISITLRLMMIAFFIFSALAIQPAPPAAAAPLGDEGGMPDPTGEVTPEDMDGVVAPLAPDLAWRAYNDCNTNIGTAPGSNVTTYTVTGSTTGLLRSYPGGTNTPVTVTFSSFNNPTRDDQGISPNAGTDAYNVFNGIVDLAGGIYYGTTGWWVDVTFTGLDPAKTYTFVTTANRDRTDYTSRVSKFTIRDLTSAANESTSGTTISTTTLTNDTTAFLTGYNTVNGYVARWTGINPGADGDFTVRAQSNSTTVNEAYGPSGFMLGEEGIPPTTVTYQQGVGSYTGTRDTTLKSNSPTTNYGSQAFLEWDTDAAPGTEMALLQFTDIFGSGAGQIPPGSTITSASLRYRTYSNTTSYGSNGNFYESLVSWDEASTYNTFGGEAGVQADEYFSTQVASGSAAANNTNYTVNVTSSLQRWSSGTAANFGWVILSAGSDGVEIHSREATNSDYRPLLTVTYSAPLGPTITTAGTLTAFSSTPGTPSAAQTYTVSGSNLTEGILITPPAGFELSTDGTNYHPTLTLPQSGGTVGSTTIHVRLNSLTEGSFSGNITHTSAGATQRDVAVSGTVITPLTEWIAYNDVAWSTGQTTTNITTYTDPGDGTSSGLLMDYLTGRSTGVTATLTESGGPYAEYTTYGGTETAVGTDAYNTFHGFADMPGVIHYGSTTGWWLDVTFTNLDPARTYTFATSANRAGDSGYLDRVARFTITGVDAATNASTAGTTISPSGDYTAFPTGENTSTGYVARWTGIQPGADGRFTIRSQAHGTVNQAYAFSVFLLQMENTAPTITTAGTLTAFSSTPGTPSAAQTYTVSGSNLTEGILITPPAGFELSTDGTNYHPTLTLPQSGGTVGNTTIHIRLTGAVGTYSGNITHTSAGATQRDVAVSGEVSNCQTVSLEAVDDNYISNYSTSTNNNYGASTTLKVTRDADNNRAAFFRWDLSAIPSNATVDTVSLSLYISTAASQTYNLYNMRRNWVEGTGASSVSGDGATWLTYDGSLNWTTPGASSITSDRYDTNLWSAGTTSFSTTGTKTETFNTDGEAVVQGWINGSGFNYGLTLQNYSTSTSLNDDLQFASSENTTNAGPTLNVSYCMPITCYALTLSHTGDGTTPSASPANSSGCAAGSYISGESITLSGAVPASGWEISNWTGTSNNSSTASSNSLVMPASNYAAGVNYRVINASPNLPVLVQPADDATGISTSPTLEVTASDPNAGDTNLTVNFYGRPAGGTTGADFTLIAIPDTQNEAQSYPTVMLNQLDWIELGTPDNIVFATGLGDIVNTYSSATQYNNADAAYDRLDLAGVPYTVSPGNHDTGAGSLYETYFGVSRFTGKSWYQGHYGSDNNNNYSFFSASGNDFILINLQYSPGTAQLDWADALLKANPTRRGIVVQHDILNIDNNFVNSTSYNALRDNPNLFLMLCGHMHSASDGSAYRAETGTDGHTIHILMTDYQDYPNGGNGYLRLLRFSPAVDKIYASIYSPTIPGSLTSAANYEQFEMVYDLNGSTAASYTLIGTTTAANGGNASVTGAGLSDNTEYEWYATVSDATLTTTGPTWSFTTGSAASTHTIPLEQGWNLISFNLHPADTSITSVLASVAGSYDLVYAWDASVTMNNWSHYAPGAGAGNTLTSLDAHQGFWIHMTAADTLEVSGTPPTTTNITLYPTGGGWNLVGYPSAASQALPGVLSNHGVDEANLLIFAYHPADTADPWKMYDRLAPDYANDLPALTPGGGYWIKVGTTLRTWTVAY